MVHYPAEKKAVKGESNGKNDIENRRDDVFYV